MRSGGINWLAVIVAAVAVYAVGFVIYGLLVPEESMAGMTEVEKATAMSRMMYGPLMPILTAAFIAVLFKWGAVEDMVSGIKWGAAIALASAVPAILYAWVYGGADTNLTLIDISHLGIGHIVAGAIIGGWR